MSNEPTYLVDTVFSWRKFRKVLRFSWVDGETGEPVAFFCEFYYTESEQKTTELRYRFWMPWKSEEDSKAVYLANETYQKVIRHFIAVSYMEFSKGT